MVYIHFPSHLTEEELMLQAKYQKLKKKKKALQAHKAPKQEPEKPLISKRPADARDAREVARKLLKSGAIQAIQKPLTKQDQTSFKRPKGQERKRIISDTNVSSYQPFSATQTDGTAIGTGSGTGNSGGGSNAGGGGCTSESITSATERETNRVHNLYQQFATERDREERGLGSGGSGAGSNSGVDKKSLDAPSLSSSSPLRSDKPRTGNTIFVSGNKVDEEFIRTHFGVFGKIVNVSMEIEKWRGFVTFNKQESADTAIADMHGKTVAGTQLQVQLARRQPKIEPINDASSSAAWSTIAASHSQKGSHKDKRDMVQYDDMNLYENPF